MDSQLLDHTGELPFIEVVGAREHNLKGIDVRIPKRKLVVITGVSGSGKTSLAFDTIFAEGQRRYVESLSSYARQFLGQAEKPRFESIRGLSPTISIEQKSAGKNPRSTVGTITEIYDYLRVLFARAGVQHCHKCDKVVGRGDAASMVDQVLGMPEGTQFLLLAPLVENRKGEYRDLFSELQAEGFARIRVDGIITDINSAPQLAKHKKHNIEVVVDRLVIEPGREFRMRVTDSMETALRQGNGRVIIHIPGREDLHMSEQRSCCGFAFPELDPPLFSFNAPLGMCPTCNGIGEVLSMDPARIVPDSSLSIREGAVVPWKGYFSGNDDGDDSSGWGREILNAIERDFGVDFDKPWKSLSKKARDVMLFGSDKEIKVTWKHSSGQGSRRMTFEGLVPMLMRRYMQTKSEEMKAYYEKFMSSQKCEACQGRRLKPEVLAVRVGRLSIMDFSALTPPEAIAFLDGLALTGNQALIAQELVREIRNRLTFLVNVGLDYITLDRRGPTLSGGEAQRLRLASQVGSDLSGVIYILDEPSIGLHQRDNTRLLRTLQHLRDIGNTVVVVEHDRETIESADYVIDMGPGAGHLGGQIVAAGTPQEIAHAALSVTGGFLSGREEIALPGARRKPKPGHAIEIVGARENNLRIDKVRIPLGLFVCITGVSGAGKSTLVNQILLPALSRELHETSETVGAHDSIRGIEHIDKVIEIDQNPIGRTPRSNPATYTKLFDLVRDLFAQLPESKIRGFEKGRFSFNVRGGRCEHCQGDGYIRVEMHFLADVFVPCEQCKGKRFNAQTLEVKYKTHSIADVLDLSVAEARELFAAQPRIRSILDTIVAVGLGYIKLGQPATTLSGGEAQRMKLSRELARRDTGRTLYVLDEPTTGLHFHDIRKLLEVLQSLVEAGNTVVVIEHNLDVIKTADWLLDLGPEGGHRGGRLVAEGTPEQVARARESHTGAYLKPLLSFSPTGVAATRT